MVCSAWAVIERMLWHSARLLLETSVKYTIRCLYGLTRLFTVLSHETSGAISSLLYIYGSCARVRGIDWRRLFMLWDWYEVVCVRPVSVPCEAPTWLWHWLLHRNIYSGMQMNWTDFNTSKWVMLRCSRSPIPIPYNCRFNNHACM